MTDKYNFSKSTVEQLILLLMICSMSEFPEDKEMKVQVQEELNTRLKKDPHMTVDLSFLGGEE